MAYIAISQSEINPDSPIVDTVFTRMRDNWIAIKDGEAGAPRIVTQALYSPTSGYKWAWQFYSYINSVDTEWIQAGQAMQMWRTGTYHFWVSIDRTSTTYSASIAVYRNGVRHSAIYTIPAGTTYQLFIFALNFNAGDYAAVWGTSRNASTIGVLGGMVDKPFAYIG